MFEGEQGDKVESTFGNPLIIGPPPDIVLETQLDGNENIIKEMYKEMLVKIGLDSPTPSLEARKSKAEGFPKVGQSAYGVNIPIRNSAAIGGK